LIAIETHGIGGETAGPFWRLSPASRMPAPFELNFVNYFNGLRLARR